MTRYSASRGIMYSAPPGPSGDPSADIEATADAENDEPTAGPTAEAPADDTEAKADD